MLGDQVYADEVAPADRGVHPRPARRRRPAGLQIADFEEYCRLYRDSWCEPAVRWLLSTVPDGDDLRRPRRHRRLEHVARLGRRRCAPQGWWDERIVGGLHVLLVLPAPRQPVARGPRGGRDATARSAPPRATPAPIVRDFAFRADREVAGARWSYRRDIGRTRIVMMDSRAGRVLDARRALDGRRRGVGLHRGVDARRLRPPAARAPRCPSSSGAGCTTSRPGTRRSATAPGARWPRGAAERLRQGLDLEHWAAFGDSLRALERPARARSPRGRHGERRRGASCCSPATSTTPTSPTRAPADGQPALAGARLPGRLLAAAQPAGLPTSSRAIKLGDVARRRARRPRRWPAPRAWRTSR